jgi:hypothetical protein
MLPAEPCADFQPSFRGPGGTPMILCINLFFGLGPIFAYSPISPDPGILGRLSVDSSGGSRKPAHEQSNNDKRTRESFAENTFASLMRMIRWRSSLGCSLSVNQAKVSRTLPPEPCADFQPSFPGHRRDAYETFRLASAPPTSPSLKYHRRPACVPDSRIPS